MKVLNLYAGIGGNRKLWPAEHEITAVEIVPKIAEIYKSNFPKDTVLIEDAHEYLLRHYKEFDFIWTSPPCPTHSQVNTFLNPQGCIRYPDMSLWQEIIFLKHFCKSKYCVENVKSYYEPMFNPQKIGRHFIWANFIIPQEKGEERQIGRMNGSKDVRRAHDKKQEERNCVEPKIGLAILNAAFSKKQAKLTEAAQATTETEG